MERGREEDIELKREWREEERRRARERMKRGRGG